MRQIKFKRRPKRKKAQPKPKQQRKPSRSARLTEWWFSQSDNRK